MIAEHDELANYRLEQVYEDFIRTECFEYEGIHTVLGIALDE